VQLFTADGAGTAHLADRVTPVCAVTGSAAGESALPPAIPLVEAIARIGATRATTPQPRPAPFYLRGADAAPPSDPPPVILP
jgi:tRNA threonylcarbamoyladenosine biosynthesis protein TsaB